jgi:hypothetical protein
VTLNPKPFGAISVFRIRRSHRLATPGHIQATHAHGKGLFPIFAQQSVREMTRTERSAFQVMADATWGAFRAGWQGPLCADADHLMSRADVDETAKAGKSHSRYRFRDRLKALLLDTGACTRAF